MKPELDKAVTKAVDNNTRDMIRAKKYQMQK